MLSKERASSNIHAILKEIKKNGYSKASPFSIGKVDKEMKAYAAKNGITLGGDEIVMSVNQIKHTLRDSKKESGKSIGSKHLAEFPLRRAKMELYYDNSNGNFVYFDRARNEKFIIHPNYTMKINRVNEQRVNYITASKTNESEFNMRKYTKIK